MESLHARLSSPTRRLTGKIEDLGANRNISKRDFFALCGTWTGARIYHWDCCADDLIDTRFGDTDDEHQEHLTESATNWECCRWHEILLKKSTIGIPDAVRCGLLGPGTDLINPFVPRMLDTCLNWDTRRDNVDKMFHFSPGQLRHWRELGLRIHTLMYNEHLTDEEREWLVNDYLKSEP